MPSFSSQLSIAELFFGRDSACTASRWSRRAFRGPHGSALFANFLERSFDDFGIDIKSGAETDGTIATTNCQYATLVETVIKYFALLFVGQVKGNQQSAATHGRNERFTGGDFMQAGEQLLSSFGSVLDEIIALDQFQGEAGADHVCKIAAPGGIDPARQAEAVFGHFIEARPGHNAANLRLFAKRDKVRHDV